MSIKNKVDHLLHPSMGEIWCLHRVVPIRSLYPSNRELEITPFYLERLIKEHLAVGGCFVPLDSIVSSIVSDGYGFLKRKQVNISFDDGFRDIYEYAFPIFKKYQIPFTIYLTGAFPQGTADIWWIQLEQLVNGDVELFESIMREIRHAGRNMREVMHEKTKSVADMSLCKSLSLSWMELKEMIDSGLCLIGSHTMTHPCLISITNQDIFWELEESKRIIQDKLKINIRHFSYPHSMMNGEVVSVLKLTGYETATLGYGGKVRKGDSLYKLNRRFIFEV